MSDLVVSIRGILDICGLGLICGTTIPLPQCGHSATCPREDSSASILCPHCGQLNVNSAIFALLLFFAPITVPFHLRHELAKWRGLSARHSAIGTEKKTSLRISREVLGNLERNTKRGERLCASSARCRLSQKVPKFLSTTALQHCKLSVRQNWRIGGFLPALSFHCLIVSFLSFQFHDLKIVNAIMPRPVRRWRISMPKLSRPARLRHHCRRTHLLSIVYSCRS